MSFITDLLKNTAGWFVGAIVIFVGLVIVYLLGMTGSLVRQGVAAKRALRRVKREADQRGFMLTSKWGDANRQANLRIWGPFLGWVLAYAAIWWLDPQVFGLSLLGLIVPVLGYFGILFGPSDDPEDWNPFGD